MPPLKAIEQAQFGGVDSRSNPIVMPTNRWLICRNWIPRPDGHLELREGYMVRVFNQTGGGRAYSLTPYTMAVPGTYGPPGPGPPPPIPAYNPVTGLSPPQSPLISQVVPNGTRCALYWQEGIPSQATASIASVACSIQAAGVPELAIYQVNSAARFVVGTNVIVEGVVSNPSSPPNFFNGTFPIEAIGNGTITLDLGISPARKRPSPRFVLPPPVDPPGHPAPQANFTISANSIDFGNIPANTPTSISVTIKYNNAVGTGTVDSASLSNTSFTENLVTPATFVNNQTLTFQVSINQPTGSYQAVLTIVTHPLQLQTFAIPISANVVASSGGGGGNPGTGNITVSPAQVAFPPTTVGTSSSIEPVVTVTNNSGVNVVFSNAVFSNPDFTLLPPGGLPLFPVSVPNGGIFSFQLSVKPSKAGTDTGVLTIQTDDAALPQLSISLQVQANLPGTTGYPENFGGSGGTIVAVVGTPGPPQPLLVPLTTAGGTAFLPGTFPMKGMPIQSTGRWHYALGKDGYLYMTNGIDFKFFDGVCFRDVGLPVLTKDQVQGITVIGGMSVPNPEDVLNVSFSFVPATEPPPTQPNAVSSFMYMAYFDKSNNVLAPSPGPLSGNPFPNGDHAPAGSFLQVDNLPPPKDGLGNPIPSAVTLLYYPTDVSPVLLQNTICNFYPHTHSYNSAFEYQNANDPHQVGSTLPGSPQASYILANNEGLLFNPGYGPVFPGWTGDTAGNTGPMVAAGVNSSGKWDGTTAPIWIGAVSTDPANWCMTVEGNISIPQAGDYTFIFAHDDGGFIGFGKGAVYVSGFKQPGYQSLTADKGYPVMCLRQTPGLANDTFIVNFPEPGVYPFEINYCNWRTQQTCCLYNGDGSVIRPGVAPVSSNQAVDPSFLTQDYGQDYAALSASTTATNTVNVYLPGHGFASGDVIVLALHKHPSKTDDYKPPYGSVTWSSNGPFAITVVDANNFTFNTPQASLYNGAAPITIYRLIQVTTPNQIVDTDNTGWPKTCENGVDTNQNGNILLPGPLDTVNSASGGLSNLIPGSAIGGAQPGYLFFACIYDPLTGHVGNRIPLGVRLNNKTDTTAIISGLPDLSKPSSAIQTSQDPAANSTDPVQGKIPTIPLPTWDPEWRILIGRTGDGGEVPYACIDSQGNWITTLNPSQTSVSVTTGGIDNNSELPYDNYPPPRSVPPGNTFANFWREGDRMCGSLKDSPFVYRSASEVDDTTGIFVGLPAQAWDPAKLETFPTAESVIGGFGYMQESWAFTRNDVAQLSEMSGEVGWNGPYNFGIVGPFAFDKGWQSLPYWVSHDRQLCTMLPDGNGPIAISTEYEKTLLARIGDEYDASGNHLGYMEKTEVVYFRDPTKLIDCLRIKCVDNTGAPFTVIHDFNLRDDSSPYGQAYEEDYLGPLATDYEQTYIRDSMARARMWAPANDGQIYQFYTGGLDNCDYYDGTIGDAFTADAISLRYMGGERTVARTLEWYGDNFITWYIFENMLNVESDQNSWVNVTYDMRPFPGDAMAAHYIADIQRPEMIHCYLWAQLIAHPADAPVPLTPMALNNPPHIPLEQYGRLYLAAPWLGTSRGR